MQQTGCQDIMSEWSNRLGVRILCLNGATDWVSGYCVSMEQQTGCQDLCLRGATDWVSGYCVSGAIDCVSGYCV